MRPRAASDWPPDCSGAPTSSPILWAHDVVFAVVPDLPMAPLGERAACDAPRGRQRRRSRREGHVQRGSDRGSAFMKGILSRTRDLDRRTAYTPRRVPQLGDCMRRERQQAGRRRRKKRYAYVPHVFNLP